MGIIMDESLPGDRGHTRVPRHAEAARRGDPGCIFEPTGSVHSVTQQPHINTNSL